MARAQTTSPSASGPSTRGTAVLPARRIGARSTARRLAVCAWSSVLLLVTCFEHGFQRIEPVVPVALVELEPRVRARERLRLEPATMRATVDRPPDQACALEGLDVFARRRQRHVKRLRELADALF